MGTEHAAYQFAYTYREDIVALMFDLTLQDRVAGAFSIVALAVIPVGSLELARQMTATNRDSHFGMKAIIAVTTILAVAIAIVKSLN